MHCTKVALRDAISTPNYLGQLRINVDVVIFHSRYDTLGVFLAKLPNSLAVVFFKCRIAGDDGYGLSAALSNEQPVKRIFVMLGKLL